MGNKQSSQSSQKTHNDTPTPVANDAASKPGDDWDPSSLPAVLKDYLAIPAGLFSQAMEYLIAHKVTMMDIELDGLFEYANYIDNCEHFEPTACSQGFSKFVKRSTEVRSCLTRASLLQQFQTFATKSSSDCDSLEELKMSDEQLRAYARALENKTSDEYNTLMYSALTKGEKIAPLCMKSDELSCQSKVFYSSGKQSSSFTDWIGDGWRFTTAALMPKDVSAVSGLQST